MVYLTLMKFNVRSNYLVRSTVRSKETFWLKLCFVCNSCFWLSK